MSKRIYNINQLNSDLATDAKKVIDVAEEYYYTQIKTATKTIIEHMNNSKIVLLSGPSGSTKTTTSEKITDELKKSNINSIFISLDNFFIDNIHLPILPNGDTDYESVQTLDMPTLQRCLHELLVDKESVLPIFDFPKGRRSETQTQKVTLKDDTIVIIEGIHAINPKITMHENSDNFLKVYVSPNTDYCDDNGEILLSGRVVRLVRRLVRDYFYRGNSYENTLKMWVNVVNSEIENIIPYAKNADILIDTSILYEPCIFSNYLQESAPHNKATQSKYQEQIDELLQTLGRFATLSRDFIPSNTVLHEFIK